MTEREWPLFPPMPWANRRDLAWRILRGEFNQVLQVRGAGTFEELTLRTRPPVEGAERD